jgi:hypothetical protein
MKKIVVLPGGYHPYHAGHYSLFKAAEEKFPDADVYLAATNDTKTRPFPFEIKKKLAQLAGVNPDQFVQVKSPFKAEEITQKYDPESDVLIFVRSEKDRTEQPKPGGTKKDGSPSYFQPYDPDNLQPFSKHAYIEYLPTIEFGPGIKSATEIRNAWPNLNERQKLAMVMSLYPATQKNKKLADVAVKMLDAGIIGDTVNEGMTEAYTDDTEEQNKNLRYARSRSPVAADIRKYLGMTGSSDDNEETDKEQDVDEATLINDPENLAELFDTSMKIRWSGSDLSYKDSYFTASNGVKYRIILSNPDFGPRDLKPGSFFKNLKKSVLDNAKYLEFLQITKDYESTTGIEGTGAAAEVFGVVANAIIRYIQDDKPSMIYFQAKEPNRVRLYRSMIKMILSKLPGWQFKEVTGKKTKMLGNFAIYNSNLINDQQGVEEATLINDPEQGHLIVPDGGMGTWDEQSLLSNLTRKFSSMVEMIKEKRYSNLYHSLYEAGVVENMLKALIEYENFKEKQGKRPIAKGRSIDLSEDEKPDMFDEIKAEVRKSEKMNNATRIFYYTELLNTRPTAATSYETFINSWAGEEWFKRNRGAIQKFADESNRRFQKNYKVETPRSISESTDYIQEK